MQQVRWEEFIVKSTNEKLKIWEQRINERIRNRLTVDQWCVKNGFTKYQYYYWNRLVHKKQKFDGEVIFADVTTSILKTDTISQKPVLSSDFQLYIKDIQVTVPVEFNQESLAGLIKVLRAL